MNEAGAVPPLLIILCLGCGDRSEEKKVDLLEVAPPKITVTKKKHKAPEPLPGRCDSSEDCEPTFKCVLSQCRKAPCRVETDKDGDGRVDREVLYTYNDRGDVLTKITEGEGATKERIEYTYDEGHLVRTEVRRDGRPAERTDVTYDAAGRPRTQLHVKGGAKTLTSFAYDKDGNKTRILVDTDGDGKPNTEERYTYDAKGNLVTRESVNAAKDKVITRRLYTYNENDRVASEKLDRGADGLNEETTLYEYDGHGNELVRDWKSAAPTPTRPETRRQWVFKRDKHGNVLTWDVRGPARELKSRTVYTYNDEGDTLTRDTLRIENGEPRGVQERVRYRYTPARNLMSEETIKGEAGPVVGRITYGYDCWR